MEDINLEDEANWPIDKSNPPTEEGEKPKKIKLPVLLGGKGYKLSFLMDRAFECLGSDRNDQVFMIVEEALNAGKGKVRPPVFFFFFFFFISFSLIDAFHCDLFSPICLR